MNSLLLYFARVFKSRGSTNPPSLVGVVSAGAPPRGGEICGSRTFNFLFLFDVPSHVYNQTRKPFARTIAQKMRFDVREYPLGLSK